MGEEGTAGGLNAVEGLCQFGFGDGHIGSVSEERERHADTEGLGEAFGSERCALDGMRGLVEQKTQRVFDFANVLLDGRKGGFDLEHLRFCTGDGS